MSNRLLTHLRHVDLAVPDYDKQLDFYAGVWGLTKVAEDSGISFLAAEGSPEQYVVRLRKADEKRLDLVSYGAASAADVDTLAEQLLAGGVQLISQPGKIDTPGGGYGFRFFDVDGRTIEVSADVEVRQHRKIEEKESIPVKLSHVVLNSPDLDRTREWYERHLGFRLSDTLSSPHVGDVMHFMRISNQHHSMAIAKGPHTSLHHVSFEMRGLDEYMRGSGRVMRAGFTKVWGPGRHMAGDNTFTYFLDPHGNTVEYTTELELLDEDTWHPHVYDFSQPEVADQWGTANPDERTGRQGVLQRRRPRRASSPRRSDPLEPRGRGDQLSCRHRSPRPLLLSCPPALTPTGPSHALRHVRTPRPTPCGRRRRGRHTPPPARCPLPDRTAPTQAGSVPELLDAGTRTLDAPAGPHVSEVRLLPPLQPPTVRDFVTFEEHVEGVRRSVDGGGRGARTVVRGARPSTSPTPTRCTARTTTSPAPGIERPRLRAGGRRRDRQGGPRPHPRAGPRPHRRLHRSSTTGRRATCSPPR